MSIRIMTMILMASPSPGFAADVVSVLGHCRQVSSLCLPAEPPRPRPLHRPRRTRFYATILGGAVRSVMVARLWTVDREQSLKLAVEASTGPCESVYWLVRGRTVQMPLHTVRSRNNERRGCESWLISKAAKPLALLLAEVNRWFELRAGAARLGKEGGHACMRPFVFRVQRGGGRRTKQVESPVRGSAYLRALLIKRVKACTAGR
jgi:hypothetical protein